MFGGSGLKLIVEGKEYVIHSKPEKITKDFIVELLRELDREVAAVLVEVEWDFRVEGDKIIVIRKVAFFG